MNDLTLLFFLLSIGVYLLNLIFRRTLKGNEITFCSIILAICAIVCIITDETCRADTVNMLPLFPVFFILLHNIAGLVWK